MFVLTPVLVAQAAIVEDIEIRGNRTVSIEEIRKHIETRVGEKLNPDRVKKDLEAVMSIGKFDKLKSYVVTEKGPRDGVVVIFKLVELQ
jgi:outer membrane protein assembly factor BamA